MNAETGRPLPAKGLPREFLFYGIPNVPATRVPLSFLEQKVWWWRYPGHKAQLWAADLAEGWPDCELAELFPPHLRFTGGQAQDEAVAQYIKNPNAYPWIELW